MIQGSRTSKLNEDVQKLSEKNIPPRIQLKNKKLPEKTKFTLQYDSYINSNKYSDKHTDTKRLVKYSKKDEGKVQRNAKPDVFPTDAQGRINNIRKDNTNVKKINEGVENQLTEDRDVKTISASLPFLTDSTETTTSEIIDKALPVKKAQKSSILNSTFLNVKDSCKLDSEPQEKYIAKKQIKTEEKFGAPKETFRKSTTCPPIPKFTDKNLPRDRTRELQPGKSCTGHLPVRNVMCDADTNSDVTSSAVGRNGAPKNMSHENWGREKICLRTHSCEAKRMKSESLSLKMTPQPDIPKRKRSEDCIINKKSLRYISEKNLNPMEKTLSEVCGKMNKSGEDLKGNIINSDHQLKKPESQENKKKNTAVDFSKDIRSNISAPRMSFTRIDQHATDQSEGENETLEDLKRRSHNDELSNLDKMIWSDLEIRQTCEKKNLGYESGDESDEVYADSNGRLLLSQEECESQVQNPDLKAVRTRNIKQDRAKNSISEIQPKRINIAIKDKLPIKDQRPRILREECKANSSQLKSKKAAEEFKAEKQPAECKLKNTTKEGGEETTRNVRYNLRNAEQKMEDADINCADKFESQDFSEKYRFKYTASGPQPDHLRESLEMKCLNETAQTKLAVEKCEKRLDEQYHLKCLDGRLDANNIKETIPTAYALRESESIQVDEKIQGKHLTEKPEIKAAIHYLGTSGSNCEDPNEVAKIEALVKQPVVPGFFKTHDKVGFIGRSVDEDFVSFEAGQVTLYQPHENQMLFYDIANCVATQAYLKMSGLRFDIEYRKNAEQMSPSGRVPFISSGLCIIPEFEGIVSFMQYKKFSCVPIEECDKPSFRAMVSMVVDTLESSERYICWYEEGTLQNYTKPRVGGPYPFPLNHIMNLRKRFEERRHLEEQGITRKSFDMILIEINSCFRNLSQRLGDDYFFFGRASTELDALVYGHIYALFTTELDGPFREIRLILKLYPNLISFVENFDKIYSMNKFASIENLINA